MNCTHENGWRRPFDVIGDRAVLATFAADFADGCPTTQRLDLHENMREPCGKRGRAAIRDTSLRNTRGDSMQNLEL